jgi:hypothetical protein
LDFDGDGDLDIVVAVLGIFGPSESPKGQVTLLVNEGGLRFTSRAILTEVTRVADVQPADFNGDGRIDFAVAEFGHRTIGSVGWLEQRPDGDFTYHRLLAKAGAIHVPVVDLDGDGARDIVAGSFFTDLDDPNRHSLVWFENDGSQQFTPHSLARIPRSMVTLELADLDEDGRLDLVAGGLLMPGYANSRAAFGIRAPLSLWSRR